MRGSPPAEAVLRIASQNGVGAMANKIPNVPGGPHLRNVAMPRDTNASGTIFGEWTVSQMDLAGGTFVA